MSKLLLVAVAIAVILFVLRAVTRARKPAAPKSDDAKTIEAEDMVKCPVCGTYVAPSLSKPCGRERCPALPK